MINQIDVIDLVRTKAKLKVCNGNVRKVNHQAETEEQAALIEWADKTVIDGICIGDYLIHIPNERKRGPKAARDAKRLGLLKGGAGFVSGAAAWRVCRIMDRDERIIWKANRISTAMDRTNENFRIPCRCVQKI